MQKLTRFQAISSEVS